MRPPSLSKAENYYYAGDCIVASSLLYERLRLNPLGSYSSFDELLPK